MENEELISVKKVSKVYRLYDRAIDSPTGHFLFREKGRSSRDYRHKRIRKIHHAKDYYRRAYPDKRHCGNEGDDLRTP